MPVQQHIMAEQFGMSPESTTSTMDPDSPPSGNRQRQRLKPWLMEQIENGRHPGVSWVDRQEGIFRIPWKHCGRSDWLDQDGSLYKAWAIHTGRFNEGVDKPDWPTWKTRLRCALNKMKPDIVCLEDQSTTDDVDDPYRVYKFNKKKGAGSASPYQQQQHTPQSVYSEDSNTCSSPSHLCHSPYTAPVPQPNIPSVVIDTPTTDGASAPLHSQGNDDPAVSSLGSSLGQLKTGDLVTQQDISISQYLNGASMESNMSISTPPRSMETNSLKDSLKDAGYEQLAQLVKTESELHVKSEPDCAQQSVNPHEMTLTIRYRGNPLAQPRVTKPQGCRVFHGDNIPNTFWVQQLFGDIEAEQVLVPDVSHEITKHNHKDAFDYLKLLKALQLGISIYVDQQGDICILRRCQASVFTVPPNKGLQQAVKVERTPDPMKIFDFRNDFLPALILYNEGQGPRPSPLVVIAIGQTFRADDDPYGSLLLSVTVCHSLAAQLLAQHVPESPPLQISHSNEYETCLEHVKTVAGQGAAVTQAPTLPPHAATVYTASQQ